MRYYEKVIAALGRQGMDMTAVYLTLSVTRAAVPSFVYLPFAGTWRSG